jgi:hypothetical protein
VLRDIGRCGVPAMAGVGSGLRMVEGSAGGRGLKVSNAGGTQRGRRCETDGLDIDLSRRDPGPGISLLSFDRRLTSKGESG